jgi:hypothetical protein
MKKHGFTLAVVAMTILSALPVMAQQQRRSPHETIKADIDGNQISITYGRPYTKNPKSGEMRKIWGGLVPYGKAWRMGADEATTLVTQKPILMGGTTVPAGTNTLYMVPAETGLSKLAISTRTGQWGIPVDETKDLARVDLKKDTIEKPVDQFTMAVEKNPAGGGVLKLSWETTQFSVSFTVPK